MSKDIDEIIAGVRARFPDVRASQLQVKYPGADDDGLWFFALPGIESDIHIESSSGMCPFIIEHNEMKSTCDAWRADSVAEAVAKVSSYLASLANQ